MGGFTKVAEHVIGEKIISKVAPDLWKNVASAVKVSTYNLGLAATYAVNLAGYPLNLVPYVSLPEGDIPLGDLAADPQDALRMVFLDMGSEVIEVAYKNALERRATRRQGIVEGKVNRANQRRDVRIADLQTRRKGTRRPDYIDADTFNILYEGIMTDHQNEVAAAGHDLPSPYPVGYRPLKAMLELPMTYYVFSAGLRAWNNWSALSQGAPPDQSFLTTHTYPIVALAGAVTTTALFAMGLSSNIISSREGGLFNWREYVNSLGRFANWYNTPERQARRQDRRNERETRRQQRRNEREARRHANHRANNRGMGRGRDVIDVDRDDYRTHGDDE